MMMKSAMTAMADVSVDALTEEYRRVRGDDADAVWAAEAACELCERWHVDVDRACRVLEEQCTTFRAIIADADLEDIDSEDVYEAKAGAKTGNAGFRHGASLNEMFGDPKAWAFGRVEEWREEGIDAFAYERPESMRNVTVTALKASAPVYVVFWLLMLASGWSSMTWSLALVPFPVMSGDSSTLWSGDGLFPLRDLFMPFVIVLMIGLARTVYRRVLRNISHMLAVVTVGVLAVVAGLGGAMLSEWLLPPARVNAAWMLLLAAVWALSGWVVARLWREPSRRSRLSESSPFVDDATWIRDVGRLLRERGDITDGAARRICDEAEAFSARSGSDLVAEFGTPAEYAHRFRETSVRARREMAGCVATVMLLTLIMGLALLAIVGGQWHGSLVPVGVQGVFYVMAVVAMIDSVRRYRHAAILAKR
ncbi:hypothetical protein [Bifidobacterium simiarum]|uniref:Uncharacterized protein n=1 Tax=Bifidobacterium simiarum TaxID=2045441 RepID=A0A2M9HD08_9BIFI|nr:hypothetical protein [Bifidobacterium simiarum]PJM74682.1 hypothetical protein CSQ87_09115 [Bifidobacterium simiarum]